ncbi:LysR family transcriptional regulator [Azohydromonas caseinilytica]|uniref:LysR family transcriptional regulator n=1 Tax=Azohydromonas caseinilytica TaxID=2728836 RepID=A0A848FHM7_9BURK|nr:LysR family transcriptional regulator [Azohydromonas caseinilytica]NML17789.1 LysR family transcriptional regulator [Azohydromonas caseinilytica]
MSNPLDSRALRLFVAVAQTLNFRQAAEVLHMSQPPLSRGIRELEQRLGVSLFERNTRVVALTRAGALLLPRALRILRLLEEARDALTGAAEVSALRIGLTTAVAPSWFDDLEGRLQAQWPGARIELCFGSSPQLVRQLRGGRLQAAFIALPAECAGLQVEELERYPLCVALPATHPLSRRRRIRLEQLCGEALFWFERRRQPAFFDHCRAVFARSGLQPRQWLKEPVDHHVLMAEVAAGKGIALLPSTFRTLRRRGVAYRPLAEGEALSVGIGLCVPPAGSALLEPLRRVSSLPREERSS